MIQPGKTFIRPAYTSTQRETIRPSIHPSLVGGIDSSSLKWCTAAAAAFVFPFLLLSMTSYPAVPLFSLLSSLPFLCSFPFGPPRLCSTRADGGTRWTTSRASHIRALQRSDGRTHAKMVVPSDGKETIEHAMKHATHKKKGASSHDGHIFIQTCSVVRRSLFIDRSVRRMSCIFMSGTR